jgi:hypothetical protein
VQEGGFDSSRKHLTAQRKTNPAINHQQTPKGELPTNTEHSELKLINKGEAAPIKEEYSLR